MELCVDDLGQALGKHAFLNMVVKDLEEMATALSMEIATIVILKQNNVTNVGERICE